MRLPKWLVRASVLCFCLLVVLLQRKNIELADARAEKAGQESERSEFAREVNLEYTQGLSFHFKLHPQLFKLK